MKFLRCLMADRQAATAIEYALLAALISLVIVNTVGKIGNGLTNIFIAVANDISNSSDGSL